MSNSNSNKRTASEAFDENQIATAASAIATATSVGQATIRTTATEAFDESQIATSASAIATAASVGLATKTKKGRMSAWERFEEYQNDRQEDIFLEIQECNDDVKCDVIKERLIGFAHWLVDHPLEKRTKPGESLGAASVKQYFGQVKEELKDRTPQLQIWVDHEEGWYSELRSNLGNGVERRLHRGEEDYKDPDCRALHIRCSVGKLRMSDRHFLGRKGADLESIVKNILSLNSKTKITAYRDRVLLLITFYGVGRGGEAKFLKWREFCWDDYFQNLEGVWTRMKTLFQHVVSFQCCRLGYLCDLYHAFGCYFAVEDGLHRLDHTTDARKKRDRYIFPHLWEISDATVARNLTALIRAHSDSCFKVLNQSRSLRVGANTELAMHPDVSPEQQRIAGGFAAGNNSELYTRMNPDLCLPAATALAQWPRATEQVYPPSFECVLSCNALSWDSFQKFTNQLYIIKVDEFTLDGKLRSFLDTCTASLVMYYPDMLHDFGGVNAVVRKLTNSVLRAKLSPTYADAGVVLSNWSKLIKVDYDKKNNLVPRSTDATTLQTLQAQSVLINELVLSNQELTRCNEAQGNELMRLSTVVANLPRSLVAPLVVALSSALGSSPSMLALQDSTQTLATRAATELHNDALEDFPPVVPVTFTAATSLVQDVALHDDLSRPASLKTTGLDDLDDDLPAALPAELVAVIREFRQSLEQVDEANIQTVLKWKDLPPVDASNRGMYIREIIEDMVNEGLISSISPQSLSLAEMNPPKRVSKKNSGLFRAAMAVVDMVLTLDQKLLLLLSMRRRQQAAAEDFSKILRLASYQIEHDAYKKMYELDGQARTTKKTVLAIGGRYQAYMKNKAKQSQTDGPTTAPGQTSMRQYFVARGNDQKLEQP
jgi:hypothetical protein